jgi:uncharacterized membrane protein YtjA (UPF0391 family)
MLRLAIVFLVIALIAGFLGFEGVANFSWEGLSGGPMRPGQSGVPS